MNREPAAPVKSITNAFHRGTVLTQRICKLAQKTSSNVMLDTLQPAQALEDSLTKSELRVQDAYAQSIAAFGQKYLDAFDTDHITTNRLHALTINLLDQLNALDDYVYDPEAFDLGSFPYLLRESERCCEQALSCLKNLHQQLLQADFRHYDMVRDDRAQLPSLRRVPVPPRHRMSEISPLTEAPMNGLGIQIAGGDISTNLLSSTSPQDGNISAGTSYSSFVDLPNQSPQETKPSTQICGSFADELQEMPISEAAPRSTPPVENHLDVPEPLKLTPVKSKIDQNDAGPQLILREDVIRQMNSIEEFLQRRKRSRDVFQEELNRISQYTISTTSSSPRLSITTSSVYLTTPNLSESPVQNSRPNSSLLTTIMETIDHNGPPVPPKDARRATMSRPVLAMGFGPSRLTSDFPISPDYEPVDSPTLSQGRDSSASEWVPLALAGTLRVPGFGDGVVDGMEAVAPVMISDPGLMLANENRTQVTPAVSVQSQEYSVRHDTSFYKFGGFCDAAKKTLNGVGGTMKEIKRPGGMYTDLLAMRCISCSFEVGYNNFYKDQRLDIAGIIAVPGVDDIKYRTRFLTKSHLKTKLADSPTYGCIFCIEENKTMEDQDATVFFSLPQLFRHLQRHPRPLKAVEGVKVVYGSQPDTVVDFDLHFLSMEAKASPFAEIASKLAAEANGIGLITHREGNKGYKAVDPEGRPTLQFAIGARIVGISFPPRYSGTWCSGYHDSVKAFFPASNIQLEPPHKDDVSMNPKSTLASTSKWEHKPKDPNSGWLSFNKKDRITHISYPYQEFWCWSGMNSKGKWGLFPREFMDGLVDTASIEPVLGQGMTLSPATPTTSEPSSAKRSLFKLSTLSTSSNGSTDNDKEKEKVIELDSAGTGGHSSWGMKRGKTSSHFMTAFRRNGTVKSHASNDSSEYAPSSHGSIESEAR